MAADSEMAAAAERRLALRTAKAGTTVGVMALAVMISLPHSAITAATRPALVEEGVAAASA
jgi:predicted transcriptional regulator